MQRHWDHEDVIAHFTLTDEERALVQATRADHTCLGFAVLLTCFQVEGRFPTNRRDVPPAVVAFLAQQLEVAPECLDQYDWQGRASHYHRAQIRERLGFREATVQDADDLTTWLAAHLRQTYDRHRPRLKALLYDRCRTLRMEPPTPERLDRLIGSALHTTETQFSTQIVARLSAATRDHLDALLTLETITTRADDRLQSTTRAPIQILKADAGPLRVETAQQEVAKLRRLRELQLPAALSDDIPGVLLHDYRQRVLAEEPFELRRHPDPLRLALLAAFCHLRSQEITDTLVDLLSKMIHHVGIRAERKVTTVLVQEIQRVANKYGILRTLAQALLDQPQGVIEPHGHRFVAGSSREPTSGNAGDERH